MSEFHAEYTLSDEPRERTNAEMIAALLECAVELEMGARSAAERLRSIAAMLAATDSEEGRRITASALALASTQNELRKAQALGTLADLSRFLVAQVEK